MEDTVSLRSGLSWEMSKLSRINSSSLDVERDEVNGEKLSGEEKCPVSLPCWWILDTGAAIFPNSPDLPFLCLSSNLSVIGCFFNLFSFCK